MFISDTPLKLEGKGNCVFTYCFFTISAVQLLSVCCFPLHLPTWGTNLWVPTSHCSCCRACRALWGTVHICSVWIFSSHQEFLCGKEDKISFMSASMTFKKSSITVSFLYCIKYACMSKWKVYVKNAFLIICYSPFSFQIDFMGSVGGRAALLCCFWNRLSSNRLFSMFVCCCRPKNPFLDYHWTVAILRLLGYASKTFCYLDHFH